jgi:hypothetical protein
MILHRMQNNFMKAGYVLVALSIVAIVALLLFRQHILKSKSAPPVTVKEAYEKKTKINYSGMSLTIDTSKPVAIPRDMKKEPVTEEKNKAEEDPYPPISESK